AGPSQAHRPGQRGPIRLHGQRLRRRRTEHVLPRVRDPRDPARLVRAGGVPVGRRESLRGMRHQGRRRVRRAARVVGTAQAPGEAGGLHGGDVTAVPTTALRVRPPAVAGTFYPAEPAELRDVLRRAFDDARRPSGGRPAPVPRALVVPHAGYSYSGPVAASGYLT